MLSFGLRFKKDNTECLTFGNVTKSHDHLNPRLGPRQCLDIAEEGSLIQS